MSDADARRLLLVKLVHTVVWALLAGCVVALPVLAWLGRLRAAGVLAGIVFVEVLVLFVNGGRCPLTPMAARYTTDRRDNFDIFLPAWLARHNQAIFGTIYVAGVLILLCRWLAWP